MWHRRVKDWCHSFIKYCLGNHIWMDLWVTTILLTFWFTCPPSQQNCMESMHTDIEFRIHNKGWLDDYSLFRMWQGGGVPDERWLSMTWGFVKNIDLSELLCEWPIIYLMP